MKRFFVLRIMAIAVLSLSVSCSNSSKNIFDCPVDMATPVETDALTGHPVTFNEQPAMQIINLHTVDSFLARNRCLSSIYAIRNTPAAS